MSTATNTDGLTFKARWARRAVREKLSAEINALERGLSQWTPDNLPPDPSYDDDKKTDGEDDTPPRSWMETKNTSTNLFDQAFFIDNTLTTLDGETAKYIKRTDGFIVVHKLSGL
ncbi:hypothetical protein F5Y07DRAFT_403501 [Xylaria sp. FL0933]|nr:hypothetical protein F5Y07DRAFT_403501 [Xylaria sp. FL0933]